MLKEEKIQLITKITLCALSFLLCACGFILRITGHGKTGEIRQNLREIAKIYNKLDIIEHNAADIKAKYKNKSIVVNYKTERADIDYVFKYEKVKDLKTLKITYKEGESARAEDVVKAMIDSVSIIAGNEEGKVFSQYQYKNFYQTELKNGVIIKSNEGKITVQIVIKTNLLDNIKDLFFEESLTTHISVEDLTDLQTDLRNNEKFLLTKGNIMIYVVELENSYEIYASDKEENTKNIYESIMSVVSILDNAMYNELLKSNIDITTEMINNEYSIDIKPENITYNQTMNDEYVIKFTLNK